MNWHKKLALFLLLAAGLLAGLWVINPQFDHWIEVRSTRQIADAKQRAVDASVRDKALNQAETLGFDFRQDIPGNIRLHEIAASHGSSTAQRQLGVLYLDGIPGFVPPDPLRAVKWLTKAAENADRSAQESLIQIYTRGRPGIAVDLEKAAEWEHRQKYFLNFSKPARAKFFCEQNDKIVLLDPTGREKYIPKSGAFNLHPAVIREGALDCGMGRCHSRDLLGNEETWGMNPCTHADLAADECRELKEKQKQEFTDKEKNGVLVKLDDFKTEGCRELESVSASCVTDRRTIYVHGPSDTYTTYDYKSAAWEKPSTNISSSQARWDVRPDGTISIHFDHMNYQYRFDIENANSMASGAVSVFKDGQKLQSESCRLLYIDKDLLPIKSE